MVSSAIWGSWGDNRTMDEVKAENQYKRYNKLAILKDMSQLLLISYDYFSKAVPKKYVATTETTKALELLKRAVWMKVVAVP